MGIPLRAENPANENAPADSSKVCPIGNGATAEEHPTALALEDAAGALSYRRLVRLVNAYEVLSSSGRSLNVMLRD